VTDRGADNLERDWARLGILFACAPAETPPDPERLLLETARRCGRNARLAPLVATWLVHYGDFIARHRLKRLAATELEATHRPVLGLLIESAAGHGAPRELLIAAGPFAPARPPRPLSDAAEHPQLAAIAERNASELSRKWGVWSSEMEPTPDALRPPAWVLARNPGLRDRALRKGDLRCSIVESLRRDTPDGAVRSESELARLCAADRSAVRKALASLIREGEVEVGPQPANARDHSVRLRRAA
jgi:hypothetical protein